MLKTLKKNRGGFTLVEIMIVVAIIALLASIAVPSFLRARKRAQATKIVEEARIIDAAIDQYAIESNLQKDDTIAYANLTPFFKAGSRLAEQAAANDIFGNSYTTQPTVDGTFKVATATYNALSDVTDDSFWGAYLP